MLDAPGDPAPADLAARFADDVDADGAGITLVIDDLHEIVDPSSIAFLGALVEIAPPELRLVVASRTDPPFPWARLRLAGLTHRITRLEIGLPHELPRAHGQHPGRQRRHTQHGNSRSHGSLRLRP